MTTLVRQQAGNLAAVALAVLLIVVGVEFWPIVGWTLLVLLALTGLVRL